MNDLHIKSILTREDGEKVMLAAKENHHLIMQPTHSVIKNGEIVGAFNLCKLPICQFWMHSEKAQVRDSLIAINVGENIASAQGQNILLVLTKPESPFNSMLGRLGYAHLDTM